MEPRNARRPSVEADRCPAKSSKKSKLPTRVTSYRVFSKYVSFKEGDDHPDVSGIFSRECFDEWVLTRKSSELKYPASSFQRVLYAHIRGADKRLPFSAPVERALLGLIRDAKNNPWTELFKDEKSMYGKKGFKKKGYHERLEEEAKEIGIMCQTRKPSGTIDLQEFQDRYNLPNYSKNEGNDDEKDLLYLKITDMLMPELENLNGLSDLNLQAQDLGMNTICWSPSNKQLPWDTLLSVMEHFIPAEERIESVKEANERGMTIWSPALKFFMNETIDSEDPRFSPDFIFPSIEQSRFREDQPVVSLAISAKNLITHESSNSKDLFGGSLVNEHLYLIKASLLSLFYGYICHIPRLFQSGTSWRRNLLKKVDGTHMVCLTKMIKVDEGYILQIQDITDLYPNVVKNSYFI